MATMLPFASCRSGNPATCSDSSAVWRRHDTLRARAASSSRRRRDSHRRHRLARAAASPPCGGSRFIPAEPQLFDYLTVAEHRQFVARCCSRRDADTRIPALLEELELTASATTLLRRSSRVRHAAEARHRVRPAAPTAALLRDEPLTVRDRSHPSHEGDDHGPRARGRRSDLSSHCSILVEERAPAPRHRQAVASPRSRSSRHRRITTDNCRALAGGDVHRPHGGDEAAVPRAA
jgi:hypothetical protein